MTRIYFVRHAQPDHDWEDDRTRPLTPEGKKDAQAVTTFLKDKRIDLFISSPYLRSMDTIQEAADQYHKQILTEERFHERIKGKDGNNAYMYEKRWQDHDYHEDGGESIAMVQNRNIKALQDILVRDQDKNIVIGTHGTALSTILNYYDPEYNCKSFLRIIDWMPYIIELDFEKTRLVGMREHIHIHKEYRGPKRANQPN